MELEKVLRLISDNKDINPDDFDILMSRSLFEAVVAVRNIVAKRGYGVIIGLVQPVPKTIRDGCIGWAVEFKIGEGTFNVYQVNVSVHVIDSGALSHKPELVVSLTKEDGTCLYSNSWCYPKDGVPCLKDIVLNAMDKAGIAWYGVKTDKTTTLRQQFADKKEWFFLEFWKHDATLRAVCHDVDLSALKELWIEENKHYICTPIMKGLWPNMEDSHEHS